MSWEPVLCCPLPFTPCQQLPPWKVSGLVTATFPLQPMANVLPLPSPPPTPPVTAPPCQPWGSLPPTGCGPRLEGPVIAPSLPHRAGLEPVGKVTARPAGRQEGSTYPGFPQTTRHLGTGQADQAFDWGLVDRFVTYITNVKQCNVAVPLPISILARDGVYKGKCFHHLLLPSLS